MSDTSNTEKVQTRKKKDLNLAECRFKIDCGIWLSQKYQDIAKVLYSRHVKERQQPTYKSEKMQRLAYKCLEKFKYDPDPKAQKKVLATLRESISNANKNHKTFDVCDFADYYDILGVTPNEILKIAPELSENPLRTLKVLSHKQVNEIRKNYSEFPNGNKKICLTCLCFPMFGILGVTIIYNPKCFISVNRRNESYFLLLPKIINDGCYDSVTCETITGFDTYDQMEAAAYRYISAEADKKWIDNLAKLEGFKPLVDHFMSTDYLRGRKKEIPYEKPFSVTDYLSDENTCSADAKDSPTA